MEKWIKLIKQKFWEGIGLIPEDVVINRTITILIFLTVFLTFTFLVILVSHLIKKGRTEREIRKESIDILTAAKASTNSANYIDLCLNLVCPVIKAQSYGFYLMDYKNNKYVLKSIRYSSDELNEVGPSYSGLVPFKKEQYIHPVSVQNQDIPDRTKLITDGKIPLLVIPFENKEALIRIFPVKKISREMKLRLDHFAKIAGLSYHILSDSEELKNNINSVIASDNIVNRAVNTLGTEDGLLYVLIGLCLKKTGADSGFFIKKQEDELKPICYVNVSDEVAEDIKADSDGLNSLFSLPEQSDVMLIEKSQPEYYKLPPYFTIHKIDSVAFLNANAGDERIGTIVLLFREGNVSQEFDTAKMKAIQYVKSQFQELYGTQRVIRALSESFLSSLQSLMQLIDNMQPYTVGYSELMARFSYAIAEELDLPEEEKTDVYLAASLSNIGVLGISNELFFKTGKYSEIEYEAMKFHAEAGARIIEASHGSKRVADYVRYHHERIDGHGYPSGIKGDSIPLGARIIAVVQFFLAKVNGRQGRDPLSFNDALKSLEIVSDTQLDRECANALKRWVEKKRSYTSDESKSLGYCWDMRCSTTEICMDCPVYMNKAINCWEFEKKGTKCSEHGNTCRTCYIRTEVTGRHD
jgi:HD-GYP domain-containing protein (c-di-GMP phosphodiesterase class II)